MFNFLLHNDILNKIWQSFYCLLGVRGIVMSRRSCWSRATLYMWGISPSTRLRSRWDCSTPPQTIFKLTSPLMIIKSYCQTFSCLKSCEFSAFFVTLQKVHELFAKCGDVKRIIIGLDKIKKTACGFCFVEYPFKQPQMKDLSSLQR